MKSPYDFFLTSGRLIFFAKVKSTNAVLYIRASLWCSPTVSKIMIKHNIGEILPIFAAPNISNVKILKILIQILNII